MEDVIGVARQAVQTSVLIVCAEDLFNTCGRHFSEVAVRLWPMAHVEFQKDLI
jgi:hypothetical protein